MIFIDDKESHFDHDEAHRAKSERNPMHKQKIHLRNILQACVFCFALFLSTPALAAKKVQRVINKGITDINQIHFSSSTNKIIIKDNQIQSLVNFMIPDNFKTFVFKDNQTNSINGLVLNEGLEKLVIVGNQLDLIKNITAALNISEIELGFNGIDDVSNLDFSNSNLSRLSLADNQITNLNGLILNENLQKIFLDGNTIETVENYSFPSGLKTLSLTSNRLSSLNGMTLPENLITLQLTDNNFKSYSKIKNLSDNLNTLVFGDAFADSQDLSELVLPENLETLYFVVTPATQDDLKTLTLPSNLKFINFARNSITSLDGLEFPSTLRVLDLRHNPISKKEQRRIIKRFKTENPKLKIRF